jgi:sugar phosphate isomerase/epimerase
MGDALKIARDLGTDKTRVWAGRTGSAGADEAQWAAAIGGLRGFSDRAADLGVTLVLEMHNGYLSDTAEGSLRLVEGVARPNFRLNFQPMSAHGADRVMEEVRKVAAHVATVHAQNYAQVGQNRRALVSEGVVDFAGVVAELRRAGFDGYLEVEFVREEDPEEALIADARFLRSLCR